MRYSYPAGEEHDGSVGVKRVGITTPVRALDESGEGDETACGAHGDFLVELFGEAASSADYEGDGGLLGSVDGEETFFWVAEAGGGAVF